MTIIECDLLTASQTGALLGVSRRTLETRTASGHVPGFVQLWPGCRRWRKSVIERWLDGGGCADSGKIRQTDNSQSDAEAQIASANVLFSNDLVYLSSTQ